VHSKSVRQWLLLFHFFPLPRSHSHHIPMAAPYSHSHLLPIPLFPISMPIFIDMYFSEINIAGKCVITTQPITMCQLFYLFIIGKNTANWNRWAKSFEVKFKNFNTLLPNLSQQRTMSCFTIIVGKFTHMKYMLVPLPPLYSHSHGFLWDYSHGNSTLVGFSTPMHTSDARCIVASGPTINHPIICYSPHTRRMLQCQEHTSAECHGRRMEVELGALDACLVHGGCAHSAKLCSVESIPGTWRYFLCGKMLLLETILTVTAVFS